MPKRKTFEPTLIGVESAGNVAIAADDAPDLPATPKEPAKAFDPAQVPQFVRSLHVALAPKGRWANKKPEWVQELLLYTIDGLAATIETLTTKPKRIRKPKTK